MMTVKQINLSEEYSIPGNAKLDIYLHEITNEIQGKKYTLNRKAMVVVPGGGYSMVSVREGEPIAIDFFNRGYNAFVLYYDVAPNRYPMQITQLACAVDYVKKHAEEFNIDVNEVCAVGFSAGGHLTGCLANMWNCLPQDYLAGKDIDAKVKAVVLSYPVIYNDSHVGTFKNLLGITDVENDPMANALSLERTVNADNPPCFIWTTATDKCVNPLATVKYVEAYLNAGKTIECHMWPYGAHGASTCDGRTNENYDDVLPAKEWLDLADRFICKLK